MKQTTILIFKKKSIKKNHFIVDKIKNLDCNNGIINYCNDIIKKHTKIKSNKNKQVLWKFGDIDINSSRVCDIPYGYGVSSEIDKKYSNKHIVFFKLVFKSLDALVLDYDNGLRKKDFMKATLSIFGGLKISNISYFIYDSFSSTKEKEKFKVVIPIKNILSKTISYNKKLLTNIFTINGFKPDPSCFNDNQWQNEPFRSVINYKSFKTFSNITNYVFDLSSILNDKNVVEESKCTTINFIKDNEIVCKRFNDIPPKCMDKKENLLICNMNDSKNPLFNLAKEINIDVRRTHNTNPLKKDIEENKIMYETIQKELCGKKEYEFSKEKAIKNFMNDDSNKFICVQKYLGLIYRNSKNKVIALKEIKKLWFNKYKTIMGIKWENKIISCWVNK